MSIFKCKMCGGTIEFEQGATIGVCDSCGTKQTISKTNDETIINLYNRANNLRLKSEFDKAADIYEKIIEADDSEAEAHWGIILCKYGIEYVDDPKTGKKIPTCHRTLFEAVTANADYQSAIDYSDMNQQIIYEAEARAIDRIQKDILAIVKNEKPFDVFICYKETDANGNRTKDSVIANDIYYQLTQEGFKVFYAAITLEDKLGQEYEPYIFAALNSAKVMLVIGSDPMYFNAVWVKNEWSRFLKFMKTDRSKLLIPCYKDMDAYELPEEFSHLQAQDMSKIGFINDIIRGIKKVIRTPENDVKISPKINNEESAVNITPLLKRAFMFLEDKDWQSANDYCEKILDQDPENAQAYLYKLMAELSVSSVGDLKKLPKPFDDNKNFKKACRFSDALSKELNEAIDCINKKIQREQDLKLYSSAMKEMGAATDENTYLYVASLFKDLGDFKDSKQLYDTCLERAEDSKKQAVYNYARTKMVTNSKSEFELALKSLRTIQGWKDVDSLIEKCEQSIESIKAKEEADRIEAERKAEERRIAAEKAKKRRKMALAIGVPIVACIAFLIVLTMVIIPNSKYNAAVSLMNDGKYKEAIAAFEAINGYEDSAEKISDCQNALKDIDYNAAISLLNDGKTIDAYESLVALNGYKDSATKASEIFDQYKTEKLKIAKVGDIVYFGTYEQDDNTSNGKEGIEWIVLAKENGKTLVISKYALDCQPYNSTYTDVTWEKCSLRTWMNGTFLNNAFSTDEQAKIAATNVSADKNSNYSTNPGNATTDKVFLLSITEAEKYFTADESRKCAPTAYAKSQGAWTSVGYKTASGEATCWWWLRSPGDIQNSAALVCYDGSVDYGGGSVNYDFDCVRPALWINLDA